MSIETIVIVSVGSASTLFLLSASWWLWRHAPPAPSTGEGPRSASSAQAGGAGSSGWHSWASPAGAGTPPTPSKPVAAKPTAPPAKPDAIPITAPGQAGDAREARTMFFVKNKKKPVADKTEIISDQFGLEADPDAPVPVDQLQTLPTRTAKPRQGAKPSAGPPPPPPPPSPSSPSPSSPSPGPPPPPPRR